MSKRKTFRKIPPNAAVMLDAKIVIYALFPQVSLHASCKRLLERGLRGEVRLQLTNLTKLDLMFNSLPIPPEILSRRNEPATILDYYFRERKEPLNEAKLVLVGQGRVGKTSLVKRLVAGKFDEREAFT
jgi:putative ribosome biogenesis GTPase RsgA